MSRGLYAIPVQIEDFLVESSTDPLSSIPLQFIVDVYETDSEYSGRDSACIRKPEFVTPTPRSDSCRYLDIGSRFSFVIVARTRDSFTM